MKRISPKQRAGRKCQAHTNGVRSQVVSRLKIEAIDWKIYGTIKGTESVKTTYVVSKGCTAMGISFNTVWAAIMLYGDRNKTVHSGMENLLENGDLAGLAKLIYQDIQDLPNVMPASSAETETQTLAILTRVQRPMVHQRKTEYMDETNNPKAWIPRKLVYEDRDKAKVKDPVEKGGGEKAS